MHSEGEMQIVSNDVKLHSGGAMLMLQIPGLCSLFLSTSLGQHSEEEDPEVPGQSHESRARNWGGQAAVRAKGPSNPSWCHGRDGNLRHVCRELAKHTTNLRRIRRNA